MGLLIPAMLGQAQAISEDYLYDVKRATLGFDTICLWIPPFSYFSVHVLVRAIPNALLLAYFQEKAIAIIIVQLISNLLICYMCSESRALMDLYQAMSSIVAPTSFGGNETEIREHTHMTSA